MVLELPSASIGVSIFQLKSLEGKFQKNALLLKLAAVVWSTDARYAGLDWDTSRKLTTSEVSGVANSFNLFFFSENENRMECENLKEHSPHRQQQNLVLYEVFDI